MCGICGIVDYRVLNVQRAAVERMRDVMFNRGPDDAGLQLLPHVGLGHRRLSIIDLSARGHQPMTNQDRSVWLVYNGEVYDFMPLREELAAAGYTFTGDSDSEVLVHGYSEWGIDKLVERLNGMFAFAIWDVRSRQLHLVRDRLGKKPLYYGWRDGQFAFASEIKALWALAPGRWKVQPDSIARFLYWGYSPGRETIYDDVFQVLPGHILTLAPEGMNERRYWRLSFARKVRAPLPELVAETDRLLTAAVQRRLRSDVPLGAFLSGGVDSSYIVSRMAAASADPIRTFSMGTAESAHDERHYARRVAAHCHTRHTEFEVTADAWSLLPRLVWEFGQPFADAACIPTYYVAAHARRHVTVVLTGDGGDESFGGYSQHQGRYLGGWLRPIVPGMMVDRLLQRSERLLDDGGGAPGPTAARFLRYAHSDPMVNWSSADHWSLHHLPRLWSPGHRGLDDPSILLRHALDADAEFDGTSSLDRAIHHDLNMLLPFCYNVKVDVATMMSSVEARSPFQDRQVVEWAAQLPGPAKVTPWEKKTLLKQVAARWLPREVIYRPKHGFTVPVDAWFRGSWSAAAHDVIFSDQARDRGYFDFAYLQRLWDAHASGVANHGTRFWSLLWLEVWARMFVDCTMRSDSPLVDQPGAPACVARA